MHDGKKYGSKSEGQSGVGRWKKVFITPQNSLVLLLLNAV